MSEFLNKLCWFYNTVMICGSSPELRSIFRRFSERYNGVYVRDIRLLNLEEYKEVEKLINSKG